MRVFIISRGVPTEKDPLYGIFEFDQAKALALCGIEVVMLVIDFRSGKYKRKYGCFNYNKEGVKIFELSLPLNLYRRVLPLLQGLLYHLYNKAVKKVGKPDVIHAHFYSIAAIATIIKKKNDIPFFITEHSSKLNKEGNLISKLDKSLTIKAYSKANRVIAVSDALSKRIKKNFDFDAVVIHDIVDVGNYHYSERSDKEIFTFISVGNLIRSKGFDILITAFYKAFAGNKEIFLNIIGEGEERNQLQTLINQYDINNQVRLVGQKPRNEVFAMMKESDAFVLASKSETFGVVYTEAMISGLPVIATKCGGPEDFINEKNGMLVPIDDIDSLADALKNMQLKAKSYNGKLISEDCYNRFSPQHIANEIIKKYNEILSKKSI